MKLGTTEIVVPADWIPASVILLSPLDTSVAFRANLVMATESVPDTENPATFTENLFKKIQQTGVKIMIGDAPPEEVTLACGLPGAITERVVLGQKNERVRQMQLVAINKGTAFVLTMSHLDGAAFDKMKTTFRNICLNFTP